MTGGALAGLLACPLYGDHAEWLDPLFPWGDKHHDKNVACHSAVSNSLYVFDHFPLIQSLQIDCILPWP